MTDAVVIVLAVACYAFGWLGGFSIGRATSSSLLQSTTLEKP